MTKKKIILSASLLAVILSFWGPSALLLDQAYEGPEFSKRGFPIAYSIDWTADSASAPPDIGVPLVGARVRPEILVLNFVINAGVLGFAAWVVTKKKRGKGPDRESEESRAQEQPEQ